MKKLLTVLLFASAFFLSRGAAATDLTLNMLAYQNVTDGPLAFVAPGDSFYYQVQILNNSGVEAQDAVLTDDLPEELEVSGATTDRGTCAKTAHSVSCDLGNIPTGTVTTVHIDAVLDAATAKGLKVSNAAIVTAANEINPSNNDGSFSFTTAEVTESSDGASSSGGCTLVR